MNSVFVLPYHGEFGHFIVKQVRNVYEKVKAERIIVACHRGQECLFPTATEFFYEWFDIPDKYKKHGNEESNDIARYAMPSILCSEKYHNSYKGVVFQPVFKEVNVKDLFVPRSTIQGLPNEIDVVVGARQREAGIDKNLEWNIVVDFFKSKGLTVGVIGLKETTFLLRNADYYAYDYENTTNASVGLLSRAKYILNTDSGLAHLTTLMQKKQVVIAVSRRYSGRINWIKGENPERVKLISSKAFVNKDFLLRQIKEKFRQHYKIQL